MIKSFFYFIRLIFLQKHLIVSMAKREVATQYVGSLLGFVWTFVNPLVMIFVFWVVFSVGFRVQPMKDVPFVVWLTAGMAAWFLYYLLCMVALALWTSQPGEALGSTSSWRFLNRRRRSFCVRTS